MIFITLLIIQLVIFGALAFILRSVLTRHISGATGHLQAMNQESRQKLEEAKKRLEEANQHYDQTVAKAKMDAEKIKEDLIKEGQEAKEALLRQARVQGEAITKQAQNSAEVLMHEMDEKIQSAAILQSQHIVQQLLQGGISQETHTHWVGELIKNGFDSLSRMNVAEDVKQVEVVSAYPLNSDQKAMLQKKIKEKMKRDVQFVERVDPEIIAGLKIILGNAIVDGTLKFKIQEMVRHANRSVRQ